MTALQYLCHLRPVGQCLAERINHFETLQNLRRATRDHACLSWFRQRVNVALAKNYQSARKKLEETVEREPCYLCPILDDTVSEYWVFCTEGLRVFRICVLCNNLIYVSDAVNY